MKADPRYDEGYVRDFILLIRNEADLSRTDRKMQTRENYMQYHLKHDFSHKKQGQSTEVLSKTKMAVESTRSYFQQALVDVGNWWRCVMKDGSSGEQMLITPGEIYTITDYMLQRAGFFSHIGNCVQEASLGSLAIYKVGGKYVSTPKFRTRKQGRGKNFRKWVEAVEDKTWELKFDVIRGEDFFPDPTGADLYRIEESYHDMHVILKLAEGEDAIYDKEAVAKLVPMSSDGYQEWRKAQETGQNSRPGGMRPRIKITELWGSIIDTTSGELMYENVVVTLANDTHIIRKPTPNPLWHQECPIGSAPLLEVANSVWHTALMDAPVMHNRALTEIFNLILDSGIKAVYGINQIRMDDLDDPSQVADGIPWGETLKVRASLPPGAKVLESVVTGDGAGEGIEVFQILGQEFNSAALTSDLRQGGMGPRKPLATEVVEQTQSLTSVFQGISKNVEMKLVQPQLRHAWMQIAQNWDRIDKEVFKSLFGAQRGEVMSQMDPEDIFTQTVNGVRFDVFGISLSMSKSADYRKLTTLLQTVFANQLLTEAFLKEFDPTKILGEVMQTLNIDTAKIKIDQPGGNPQGAGPSAQGPAQTLAQPGGAPGSQPNMQSQMSPGGPPGGGGLASLFAQAQNGNGMMPNRGGG